MSDVPFLPYARQTIDEDDVEGVLAVLRSDHLTSGPTIPRFERALAEAVGAPHAVAVTSGTAGLHAACHAAGVEAGDEVVVPAISFVATASCARFLGAEPVFADVDPDTGLLIADEVARRAGPRTRAVLPVHLTGAAADLSAVAAAAREVGAVVIEDATHALGGSYGGAPVGSCASGSDMAVFSFHAVKAITTGEGGAVTTRSRDLTDRLRRFRDHGIVRDPDGLRGTAPGPWYYEQQTLGHNLRMTELQAALGVSQLRKLAGFVQRRRALAARYREALAAVPGVEPATGPAAGAVSAWHLLAVLVDFDGLGASRASVMEDMRRRGIGTQVHYIPIPMQPYYRDRGWRVEEFPGALRYYERTLSLPLFPGMEPADVDRVVETLASVLADRR